MEHYVSIDIKTTGLDYNKHQILEIGAVIEDWVTPINRLPRFHCYIDNGDLIGSPYALSMHSKILRRIATKAPGYRYLSIDAVELIFGKWLEENGFDLKYQITAAGKNFASFDLNFLKLLPDWGRNFGICHRCIDPGSLYWIPSIDETLPSTKTCMERAGISGMVAHNALDDAAIVIQLIRKHFQKENK